MNMAAKQRFIRGGGWMALCVLACGLASAVPSARAQKESAAAPSAEAGAWVEVQTPHFVVVREGFRTMRAFVPRAVPGVESRPAATDSNRGDAGRSVDAGRDAGRMGRT